jgi:hypothetical protein
LAKAIKVAEKDAIKKAKEEKKATAKDRLKEVKDVYSLDICSFSFI